MLLLQSNMAYRDRTKDDDVVDVWDDEIPNMVLDRLGLPRSKKIALRACYPMGQPNRLYCFDNDRKFSDTHFFHRTETPTGTSYVLQGNPPRENVERVLRAFSDPSYKITKDRETAPRKYTAWHARTAKGEDFRTNHAGRVI